MPDFQRTDIQGGGHPIFKKRRIHRLALLADDLDTAELRGMMRLKRAQLEQHIQGEQARLARIEARLQQIEQEQKLPEYEVVLKQVPPMLVAGIREKAPSPARLAPLFDDLQRFLIADNTIYNAKRLAVLLKEEYREEIEIEASKMEEFMRLQPPPGLQVEEQRAAAAAAG